MQAQQTMWTLDPKRQLLILSLQSTNATFIFVISTSIFFDPDFSERMTKEIPIPWTDWGPLSSRVFRQLGQS